MTQIKITAHVTSFLVVEDRGDGKHTILAEFARYDDALAAARLLGRDRGIPVEAEPDARASMDHQTADALLTVRHHQDSLFTMVDDEVADVFEPILDDALNVVEAALRGISVNELTAPDDPSTPPWHRKGGAQ